MNATMTPEQIADNITRITGAPMHRELSNLKNTTTYLDMCIIANPELRIAGCADLTGAIYENPNDTTEVYRIQVRHRSPEATLGTLRYIQLKEYMQTLDCHACPFARQAIDQDEQPTVMCSHPDNLGIEYEVGKNPVGTVLQTCPEMLIPYTILDVMERLRTLAAQMQLAPIPLPTKTPYYMVYMIPENLNDLRMLTTEEKPQADAIQDLNVLCTFENKDGTRLLERIEYLWKNLAITTQGSEDPKDYFPALTQKMVNALRLREVSRLEIKTYFDQAMSQVMQKPADETEKPPTRKDRRRQHAHT